MYQRLKLGFSIIALRKVVFSPADWKKPRKMISRCIEIHRLAFLMRLITRASLVFFLMGRVCSAESVELNVVPSARASFGAAHEWARALGTLRNVRVRSNSNQRAQADVKWVGSTLHITALIGSRDELVVPGKSFSIRQTKALAAWIDAQKKARAKGGQEPRDQQFGLTASEIKRVHSLLKPPVTMSTKDISALQCLRDISRGSALPIRLDKRARAALQAAKNKTEWQGLSVGTALAGVLRPQELVLVPKVQSGRIQLLVQPERVAKDSWPVGWPPELKKHEIVPKLFDTLPAEIYDTPIRDVMNAIETRLDTPIIFDEGLLAAADNDPDKTKVTVTLKRSFYGKVIRQAVFNANMKSELRVDERGKGFFWITSAKKSNR